MIRPLEKFQQVKIVGDNQTEYVIANVKKHGDSWIYNLFNHESQTFVIDIIHELINTKDIRDNNITFDVERNAFKKKKHDKTKQK